MPNLVGVHIERENKANKDDAIASGKLVAILESIIVIHAVMHVAN
jgi:hypothetical protein